MKPTAIAYDEFELEEVTSKSAIISWKAPSNIPINEVDVLTYESKYCVVNNDTKVRLSRIRSPADYGDRSLKISWGSRGRGNYLILGRYRCEV